MNKIIKLSLLAFSSSLLLLSTNFNSLHKVTGEEVACVLQLEDNTNSYEFNNLYDAFNKASETGGTVSLLRDVNEGWSNNIVIEKDINVTFNLNGHEFKENLGNGIKNFINVKGSFTISDTSESQSGSWINNSGGLYSSRLRFDKNSTEGKINITGGKIVDYFGFIDTDLAPKAEINISGGEFNSSFLLNANKEITVNISGGRFTYNHEYVTQNYDDSLLTYNLSGTIDGLPISCVQSVMNKKIKINVVDYIYQGTQPIKLYLDHNISNLVDGVKLITFSRMRYATNLPFSFEILNTADESEKLKTSDYKIVVLDNELVVKNKNYVVPGQGDSNKQTIHDQNGNSITFLGSFTEEQKEYINGFKFTIKEVPILEEDVSRIKNLKKYKEYRVLYTYEVELLDSENKTISLSNVSRYYVSLNIKDEYQNLDRYAVLDKSLNGYYTTYNNDLVTFETTHNGTYIVLGIGDIQYDYCLGAIIPLGILFLLEVGFITFFFIKRYQNQLVKLQSSSILLITLLTELWGGVIPLIILLSILDLGGLSFIGFILYKKFKKSKSKEENKELDNTENQN